MTTANTCREPDPELDAPRRRMYEAAERDRHGPEAAYLNAVNDVQEALSFLELRFEEHQRRAFTEPKRWDGVREVTAVLGHLRRAGRAL